MVFSDALQELGDELGKQMPAARDEPLLPLGFLGPMRSAGTVKLDFRFGFVSRMSVSYLGIARGMQHRVFDAVLAQPVAQLLRELVVDMASFEGVPLEAIAAAIHRSAPRSLRRVRLNGQLTRPPSHLFASGLQLEWAPG